ncbi:cell surface hyaluronidase-like [Babylonia areolata]|uniref:cell surface hyaluronidase-like n=1 Tax=Babylonia areolata TaxID=304850 RepID=UPI003FD51CAC
MKARGGRRGVVVAAALCLWVMMAVTVHVTLAECPHQPAGKTLRRWSDSQGWTGTGSQKPTEGDTVVITDDVLLDESPPELRSVEIQESGSLVFSPDGDFTLVVGYMLVYGALHIGSEDCRFQARARIVLKASRGQYRVEGYGGKFIGVGEGATLELHGHNKLGWTKLTSTLPKLTADNGLLYDVMTDPQVDNWQRGLLSIVLDGATGDIKFRKMIYLMGKSDWRLNNEPPMFFSAMQNVQDGDIVVLAVQKNAVGTLDLAPFCDAIETAVLGDVTNTLALRNLREYDAWVLVARRGEVLKEHLETRVGENKLITAGLVVPFPELGLVVNVQSMTRPDKWYKGMAVGQIATLEAGAPIVNVAQDATTLVPGDRVLLTSTDFDWRQAEEAEVTYCSPEECNSKQLRLLMFPKFTHYGEITDGIDMRGEVALLSRNIVIEGAMEDRCPLSNGNCDQVKFDTYGGHIKIEKNFHNVHIEGVELRHMGQLMEDHRHPLYFHMCGDVDSTSSPAYVRSVSIRDSYSMCVVLSGTSGLTIQDNVAYNHFGHCYFLKEGGEKRTVLDGNLGVGTKEHSRSDLEKQSTTFLITNPLTFFRNNIAAGGNRRGIWYLFPREPVGESAVLGLMARDLARRTPYLQFTNNAAHSYGETGLQIMNELREGGNYGGNNNYRPVVAPEDSSSTQAQPVHLDRYTGFKNRYQNARIQGGYFIMDQASGSDQKMVLQNSLIVGESDNTGERSAVWLRDEKRLVHFDRSLPAPWDFNHPVQGFTVHDGPLELRDVWFNHFAPNPNRTAGALGFAFSSHWPSSAVNDVKGLKFGFGDGVATGLRFFEGDDSVYKFGSLDGDLQSMLYDVDGSLTGVPETTLVKPFPVYTTSACLDKAEWGMAVCPYQYGKLKVYAKQSKTSRSSPILTRDDLSPADGLRMPFKVYSQYPVIKGGSHSYILHWSDTLPLVVWLTGRGIQQGESVRIGMCVPRGGEIDLYTYTPVWAPNIGRWTEVSTVQELDDSAVGGVYFYDRTNGIVFVKLMSYDQREEEVVTECVNCPVLRLQLLSGNSSDADCRDRIGAYTRPAAPGAPVAWPTELPATSVTPPEGWGAGEFVPFYTRQVVDGAYGDWSDWGPCSVTCGGGSQIRTRACNSPMPQNGGLPCSGPSEDTQTCGTNPCEIHGQFSDWSEWGSCQSLPGNGEVNGYQTRNRGCDNPVPRYNGDVCVGDTRDMQPCLLTVGSA